MKSFYKFSFLVLSFLIINLSSLTETAKADNPNIQLLGAVVNNDPWPFDIPCGSTVQFAIEDVFEIYIDVTNTDYTCPVTLEYFPNNATPIVFDPPLPITSDPGATLKTHLIFTSNTPASLTIQLRARDCHDTSYCYLAFDWVLPVELNSFVSVIHGNDVTLNWSTSSEENNERFDIERSIKNSQDWNKVGSVQGSGNSSVPVSYSFSDRGLNSGSYSYRLKQIDYNGNFEYLNLSNAVAIGVPNKFSLAQNYPNPFNPTTTILYGVPNDGLITMKIYDINGKEIKTLVNEPKTAGYYTTVFNASGLSSGVYFYKLTSGNFVIAKKMVIMK